MQIDFADKPGCPDATDSTEAGKRGHLAEEEVRDHRIREGDHQEVDACTATCERSEDDCQSRCNRDSEKYAHPWVPAEVEPFRIACRNNVTEHEPRDSVERDLRKRDHAAVGGEEDQAGGRDAEKEHLCEDEADPVGAEEQWPQRRDD